MIWLKFSEGSRRRAPPSTVRLSRSLAAGASTLLTPMVMNWPYGQRTNRASNQNENHQTMRSAASKTPQTGGFEASAIDQLRTFDVSSKIVGNPVMTSTSPLMHCPYCAAELVIAAGGELQCASTGALFSRSVRTQLEALRTGGTSGQPSWSYVGRWFCPCCGEQTDDSVCPGCGVVITARLARELIELNPHVSPQMPA